MEAWAKGETKAATARAMTPREDARTQHPIYPARSEAKSQDPSSAAAALGEPPKRQSEQATQDQLHQPHLVLNSGPHFLGLVMDYIDD